MFNQDTADAICARLAEGVSLRAVCRDDGMPSHSQVLAWARENGDFANQYARAREDGDEADRGDDAVVTVAAPQDVSGADQQQEHEDLQVGHWVGAGPPRRGPAIPSSGDDAQRRGGGLRAFRVAEADGALEADRALAAAAKARKATRATSDE